ncbi:cation:proton antiporter [Candidatus Microgenomates bacterium]|nr:cation:proton antiporter [Candidatus Microgenomates bacterium]
MEAHLARDLALVLLAAFLGGGASAIFRLPLLTGYIVAGVVLALVSPLLNAGSEVLSLAQLGIILLLFTIGVELSFNKLTSVFKIAIFGGLIQILSTVLMGLFLLPLFGINSTASLILAFGFSLSSTAVVVKILQEKGELDTLAGEILIGWLLIQDLAVVPMVVLLPILAGGGHSFIEFPLAFVRSALVLAVAYFAGKFFVPSFMKLVLETKSREFFLLSIVTFVFAVAGLSSLVGISPALGAFLGGLVIAETSQNHAVFAEIRPLREVFMILFFVSLGALVDPSILFSSWQIIVVLTVVFLLVKFLLSFFIIFLFGYHPKTAFWAASGLANIGEFSFLVAALAGTIGILTQEELGIAIYVTLLTLLVTPVLFAWRHVLWIKSKPLFELPFFTRVQGNERRTNVAGTSMLNGHVVLCGYGRVGSWLGRACQLAHIPFVVIEYNYDVISDLFTQNIPYILGDPADREILEQANLKSARLLVIAIGDRHTQELVIAHAHTLAAKLPIISRAHQDEDRKRLETLGVAEVVQPEFEAALSIIHRVFQSFGMSREEVSKRLKTIKSEHSRALQ